MNTADYLLECGIPQKTALIAGEIQYSYQDLKHASSRVAGALLEAGILPGDRVGLLGSNSLFWVASYLAIMKLGAIAVPFANTLAGNEVSSIINLANVKATCVERRALNTYAQVLPEPLVSDVVFQESGRSDWPEGDLIDSIDREAALMFTSGTTARPRLVRITHRNIQANTSSIIDCLELDAQERILAVLPFYYCFGTSLLHTHLRAGGSVVMASSLVFPEVILNLMEETGCTGFAGVPSTYQILLRNSTFHKRSLKDLRKLQQAGGKLHPILVQELIRSVPHANVYIMYGQTEATARLSYLPPEFLPTKLGSIGKGIPNVNLLVIGEDGSPVKPGETGEIYASGENISPGYWQDHEASAEKFVDAKLCTGDLATIDEDGFIYVVDRKADFIKSYGFRVSSQRIEECILEIADIVAAAVIGVNDEVRGEAILAFTVRRPGTLLTEADVIRHCIAHLAHHMVPKEVIFLDSLPMNAHGKIIKNELRNLARTIPC